VGKPKEKADARGCAHTYAAGADTATTAPPGLLAGRRTSDGVSDFADRGMVKPDRVTGVRALSDYNVEFNVGQFGACLMDGGLTCLS